MLDPPRGISARTVPLAVRSPFFYSPCTFFKFSLEISHTSLLHRHFPRSHANLKILPPISLGSVLLVSNKASVSERQDAQTLLHRCSHPRRVDSTGKAPEARQSNFAPPANSALSNEAALPVSSLPKPSFSFEDPCPQPPSALGGLQIHGPRLPGRAKTVKFTLSPSFVFVEAPSFFNPVYRISC